MQYHYQPEPVTSLIYWSVTFVIFFTGLIITLENTYIFWGSLLVWSVFVFFVWLGLKRYLIVEKDSLLIKGLLPTNRKKLAFSDISKIQVAKNGLLIIETSKDSYTLLVTKKTAMQFLKDQKKNVQLKEKVKAVPKINVTLS